MDGARLLAMAFIFERWMGTPLDPLNTKQVTFIAPGGVATIRGKFRGNRGDLRLKGPRSATVTGLPEEDVNGQVAQWIYDLFTEGGTPHADD